jgi:Tol biopolymer transport system component
VRLGRGSRLPIASALIAAAIATVPAAWGARESRGWRIVFLRDYRHPFVANVDGTEVRRSGFPTYPTYSPDGRRVVFAVLETRYLYRFTVANADGSGRRPIGPLSESCIAPDWTRDGERVVFAEGCDVDFTDIFVASRDGKSVKRLSSRSYVPWERSPVWSPGGRTILYTAYTKRHPDWFLWLMNGDGSNRRRIGGNYTPHRMRSIRLSGRRTDVISSVSATSACS